MELVALTAGRLHLRPWETWDAAEVHAACQDADIQRWTQVPVPYALADAEFFTGQLSPTGWADGTQALFAVLDATTAAVHASVGLMDIADGSAELGYWTAPAARGQGYTAEAVGAVCRWGFGALGLERVLWRAELGNWGSRAVAEACGFTVEGVQRAGMLSRGTRVSAWTGSLLAGDEVRDRRTFGGRWSDLPGDGLLLRRWRDDDRPALVEAMADEQCARFLPVATPFGIEHAALSVERSRHEWVGGRCASLVVEVDGRVAGELVVLTSPFDPGLAELGWWTAPWARGRQLTARAVETAAPWLRGLGLVRLEAGVDVDNPASQRAAEQAGFTREGVRAAGLRRSPRDGVRHDGVLYARVLGDGEEPGTTSAR